MTSYTPHSIISQSSQSTNQKQTYMYFGRKGNVLFDDGNWYEGGFTGKDPKTECWVTEDFNRRSIM